MSMNVNGPDGSSPADTVGALGGLMSQMGSLVGESSPQAGGTMSKISQGLSIASGSLSLIPGFGQIASVATGLLGGISRLFGGGR